MQTNCRLSTTRPQKGDIYSSSTNWLNNYLERINQFPLLTHSQHLELFKQLSEGNHELREYLINCNLRLAYSVAKRYRGKFITFEFQDMIQEANIGLTKAVEKYDYTLGVPFATYAIFWIEQAIQRAFPDYNLSIHISSHLYYLSSKVKKTISKLAIELQREPTDEEVATALNLSIKKVQITRSFPHTISIDAILHTDDDSDVTLLDMLCDENTFDITDNISGQDLFDFVHQKLETSIISERERSIIKMYFGIEQNIPMTFEEIAAKFQITRQRAYEIYNQGIKKLRLICSNEEVPRYFFT